MCLNAVFYEKINSYCLESFLEFFWNFSRGNVIFQTNYNIYVSLKAVFHGRIFFLLSGKFSRTSWKFSRTSGKFSITSENFSRSQEICPDNLKYLSVFECCFLMRKKNYIVQKVSRISGNFSRANEIFTVDLKY